MSRASIEAHAKAWKNEPASKIPRLTERSDHNTESTHYRAKSVERTPSFCRELRADTDLEIMLPVGLQPERWHWKKQKDEVPAKGEDIFCHLKNLFSLDVKIEEDGRQVCFHSTNSISTLAVFGSRGMDKNTIAYWEVHAKLLYGTSMMFGLGTHRARHNAPIQFVHLLGEDDESFGLDYNGFVQSGGVKRRFCEKIRNVSKRQSVAIGMLFNGPKRTLTYFENGKLLGVGFCDMDLGDRTFYPMISSTAQKSVFTIENEKILCLPNSLRSLALQIILLHVRGNKFEELNDFVAIFPPIIREELIRLLFCNF